MPDRAATRRVKVEGGATPKRRKRKPTTSKPSTGSSVDEDLRGPKPGLESSVHHVALMYKGRDHHLTHELSRALLPQVARSMGIYRRK